MITHGRNVIPMKSGAGGARSGEQYDMMQQSDPGYAARYIKPKGVPEKNNTTLWTTNDNVKNIQGKNVNNNTRLPSKDWEDIDDFVKNPWTSSSDYAEGGSVNSESILDKIMKHESSGRNIPNYINDATHTAQGYFQITNSTWRDFARDAGVDLAKFPNAMSAPYEIQRQMAKTILESPKGGISRWANYNPKLKADLEGAPMMAFKGVSKENTQLAQTKEYLEEPKEQQPSQDQSLLASILGSDWIEPTVKAASKAILQGEA